MGVMLTASASASASTVSSLFETAHGSPRDFTASERHDAVRELVVLARGGDSEAARALLDLLGGEFEADVLDAARAERRDRTPPAALVDGLLTRLAALPLTGADDREAERNASRAVRFCEALADSGDARAVAAIVRVVDDGPTKEVRVAALNSLGRYSDPFAKVVTPGIDAATKAVVRYVDHKALGAAARTLLGRMTVSRDAVRPLLTHKDPELRALATRLLGDEPSDDVREALERQLKTGAPRDRARALRTLGENLCGTPGCPVGAQLRLIELASPYFADAELGDAAVSAVKHVRERALVRPLLQALSHPQSHVREQAALLLGELKDPSAKAALWQKLQSTPLDGHWSELDGYLKGIVGAGLDDDDAPRVAALLVRDDLVHTSFQSNHRAMWTALSRLSPQTATVFTPLLRKQSRELTQAVSRLLGQLGNPAAAVALLDVVADKLDGADEAALALGSCADESALPRMFALLEKRLQAESWNGGGPLARSIVRIDRVHRHERTLARIAKHDLVGIELLRAMLDETHPSDKVAFSAALAQKDPDISTTYTFHVLGILGLANIDTAESLARLCTIATTDKEAYLRRHAAVALARFPEQRALQCMVKALEKTPRNEGGDEIQRALEQVTGQQFDDVSGWRTFVDAGVGLGGEAALLAGLDHADAAVRVLAARRLGQEKQGLTALLSHLERESSAEVRAAIVTALAAHESPQAKPVLVAELERNRASWPEKIALARALDRLGEGRGTLALVKLLDSGDSADVAHAMLALSEVTGEPPTAAPSFWRAWWKAQAERYRLLEPR